MGICIFRANTCNLSMRCKGYNSPIVGIDYGQVRVPEPLGYVSVYKPSKSAPEYEANRMP